MSHYFQDLDQNSTQNYLKLSTIAFYLPIWDRHCNPFHWYPGVKSLERRKKLLPLLPVYIPTCPLKLSWKVTFLWSFLQDQSWPYHSPFQPLPYHSPFQPTSTVYWFCAQVFPQCLKAGDRLFHLCHVCIWLVPGLNKGSMNETDKRMNKQVCILYCILAYSALENSWSYFQIPTDLRGAL